MAQMQSKNRVHVATSNGADDIDQYFCHYVNFIMDFIQWYLFHCFTEVFSILRDAHIDDIDITNRKELGYDR